MSRVLSRQLVDRDDSEDGSGVYVYVAAVVVVLVYNGARGSSEHLKGKHASMKEISSDAEREVYMKRRLRRRGMMMMMMMMKKKKKKRMM